VVRSIFLPNEKFAGLFQKANRLLMKPFIVRCGPIFDILWGKEPICGKWFGMLKPAALKDKRLLRKPKLHQICEFTSEMIDKREWPAPRNYWWNSIQLAYKSGRIAGSLWIISVKSLDSFWRLPRCDDYLGPFSFSFEVELAMNSKMLSPFGSSPKSGDHWKENQSEISISQVEGFIRQIIGWREYMRGIYWAKMPWLCEMNFFGHERKLPDGFLDWEDKMKMPEATRITQSLEAAYAHHNPAADVQEILCFWQELNARWNRSMVPRLYIDAMIGRNHQYTGMSQFCDGEFVGTKPMSPRANLHQKAG